MRTRIALAVLVSASLADGRAAGQTRPVVVAEAQARVTAMSARFRGMIEPTSDEQQLQASCGSDCSPRVRDEISRLSEARYRSMDALAEDIHREIDRFVASSVSAKSLESRRAAIAGELKTVLMSADESETPPVAFDARSTGGALVVAYAIHKGGWHGQGATSFRLRAYSVKGESVELTDATGGDMDGYARNSVYRLRSPGSGETWFVVKGQLTGANGPHIRMRGYRLKAGRFETMWMPANAWGDFTIRVTEVGFTVDGPYYRGNARRHEIYFVSPGHIGVAGGSSPTGR